MALPIDIQQRLDDWLEEEPEAQKYLDKIYYVPFGMPVPYDATHTLQLQSVASDERSLTVALVVKPQFAVFLDMLLSMLATQPPQSSV